MTSDNNHYTLEQWRIDADPSSIEDAVINWMTAVAKPDTAAPRTTRDSAS